MTQDEYKQGIAIMTASGILRAIEPETIRVWKELLIDLEFKYFRQAVVDFCKTRIDFYPTTNIPALIRKTAEEIRSKDITEKNSFQKLFARYKQEAATPEEVRKFLESVKFKKRPKKIQEVKMERRVGAWG